MAIFVTLVLSAPCASAKVRLPSVIGDNMVLQRNSTVSLWGRTDAEKKVSVTTSWNGAKYRTTANGEGRWSVEVATGDAGGPYTVTISDGEELTLENILLGEVWICSGQSNMEMPVCGFINQPVEGSVEAVTSAVRYPGVRMFSLPQLSAETPVEDNPSEWKIASPKSVSSFSAVAWFFGKTLSEQLGGVPVGLINTSWGGSAIEAWMTPETIDATEGIDHAVAKSGRYDNSIPGRLYNGMIAPICNFTAKGFIWYQGESNRKNWFDYRELQVAMVELWRRSWTNERMPFYFTQLAPYRYEGDGLRSLAMLVEAQYEAQKRIPYSGIAATTDLGNPVCIHPARKREVGERLAWLALAADYGVEGLPAPAPTYKSMEKEAGKDGGPGKLVLSFENLSGKHSWNDPDSFVGFGDRELVRLGGFEIAGDDRVFHPARASLRWWENRIEVSSEEVPEPVAVRYAFRNYMPEANVRTTMGQPLVPFRTDDWEVDDIGEIH